MKVNSFYPIVFKSNKETLDKDKNPINKLGERETLLKATVIGGLGVGARALWYLFEEGFVWEELGEMGAKIVDKNKPNVKGAKKGLLYFGAWAALAGGFIAAVAAVYTIYKTPNIMYEGKINAFTKGKDMDVYIKGNKVERELYDQMNEKAKKATKEEKEKLSQQYLKLKTAKNPIPDFIKNNTNIPGAD